MIIGSMVNVADGMPAKVWKEICFDIVIFLFIWSIEAIEHDESTVIRVDRVRRCCDINTSTSDPLSILHDRSDTIKGVCCIKGRDRKTMHHNGEEGKEVDDFASCM